jgi:hypothetical protein
VSRYQTNYKRPITPGVGHAYDSVMMLVQAFDAGTRENAAAALRSISGYPGVIGPLNVKPDGIIWSQASVKVIRNSKVDLYHSPR